jgi:tetratricopeptide (TPR) repeat protein
MRMEGVMREFRLWRGFLVSAVVVWFAIPPAFGQTGSGQQSEFQQRQRPMPSQERRQEQQRMYIQGEVTFEDGSPAPANVLIERFCGAGNGIPQAYTDSKGRFSFELGQLTGATPDATQGYGTQTPGEASEELTSLSGMMDRDFPNRLGEKSVTGCSLRAVLPGFHSTTVNLGPRGRFDDPDVGDIVLQALDGVEGLSVSLVSLRAPKEAKKSFDKGSEDLEKRKWGNARKHFEKAVAVFPEYAEAWFALGRVHEEEKNPDKAREAFEKAMTADSKYVPPRVGLARLDASENQWDVVIERTDHILVMNPNDFPEAYFYNSVANFSLRRYPAAESSAQEALARGAETRFPQVVHVLALSLGYQGKAEEAVVQLKRYLEIAPDSDAAPAAREQLEGIESYLAQQPASAGKPASTSPP